MSSTQLIVNNFLIINGHSIGCSDIVPDKGFSQNVEKNINSAESEYNELFQIFQDEKRVIKKEEGDHQIGKKIFDSFELKINQKLNKIIGKIQSELKGYFNFVENNFYKMVWAGSKGKPTNITQVIGVVGQQNIEGARIRFGFNRRTLPHFQKDDNGPQSRGFVKTNYFKGLKPGEFFFHTMGGREGLSDTAVKTSKTGYLQRKLVKALEDVISRYDGTVRDSLGNIIQTSYGQDGLAGQYIETQTCQALFKDVGRLQKSYRWEENIAAHYGDFYSETTINMMITNYKRLQNEFTEIQKSRKEILELNHKKNISHIYLPVNLDRLIEGSEKKKQKESDLSPLYIIEEVEELF